MKQFLFILVLFSATVCFGQDTQFQTFVGNDGFQLSSIVQKEIRSYKKFSYFGASNVFAAYNSIDSLDLDLLNLVQYKLQKGFEIVGGISINKHDLMPQLGIGYSKESDRLNLNIFPLLSYSLKEKEMGAGLYTLVEFTPPIKNKWDLYTMLILDTDVSFKEHSESKQYVRIGTQYDRKLQFGLGLDLEQKTSKFNFGASFGVFIGYAF